MKPAFTIMDEWDPDAWAKANFKVGNELDAVFKQLRYYEAPNVRRDIERAIQKFGSQMRSSTQSLIEAQRIFNERQLWNRKLNELRKYIPCSKGKAPFYIHWDEQLDCRQCRRSKTIDVGTIELYCHACDWNRPRVIKGVTAPVRPEWVSVRGPVDPQPADFMDSLVAYIQAARERRPK